MNDNILEAINDTGFVMNIGQLHDELAEIPDKRKARGIRYTLPILLCVIILAKLSGEDTPTGISEWAQLRKKQLQAFFNYHREIKPGHNTIRRTMASSLDEADLQKQISRYLHQNYGNQQSILVVIDGKTLRGTIPKGKTQGVHLLAAYLPDEGVVLLQVEVGNKENEISAAPKLLCQLDLKGRVVSGDAMFAQRDISVQVLAQGGDYIWMVKDNQPTLKADVERFFETSRQAPGWHPPEMPQEIAQTTNKSRGRVETRRLIAMPNQDNYIQWPGLEQVFQLERRVVHPAQGKETTELFYGITSLAYQPGSAAELLEWSRQHWGIENGLHYRRDVTLREDDTRMSDTHQARVLATINNFVVALARCLGIDNLASARRFFQAKLDLALFSS
jgi:predicted transposase YbfD/YdcC